MYQSSTANILTAILMHNTDGYPAHGSLVVEKKDGGGTPQGHQSKGGSAILTDDFQCHQYSRSEMEDGHLEGHREA